jgi:hypothetical protein
MPSAYTSGEVSALIGPIFGREPDDIAHYIVICHTKDGQTLFSDSAVSPDNDEETCALMTAFNLSTVVTDVISMAGGHKPGWSIPHD